MIAAGVAAVMLSACAPTVQPTVAGNGAAHTPTLTADRYVAADGTSLPVTAWPATASTSKGGKPKAVVLGLHGFGDYRKAWEEPAEIWAKAGITTYAYDQRGFGASPTRGRWPGTEALVSDANTMLRLLRTRESFGPVTTGMLEFFAHTVPWFPSGPTSIDYMPTDNPKTLEKLRNDKQMLRQARLDMAYGLVDLMDDARDAAAKVNVPYLMLHGLGDRIVPKEPVKAAIEIMPRRPDSQLAFYKEGYHLLLRDKEGKTVALDVEAWIFNHQAPLPSGAEAAKSQPALAALWGSKRSQR